MVRVFSWQTVPMCGGLLPSPAVSPGKESVQSHVTCREEAAPSSVSHSKHINMCRTLHRGARPRVPTVALIFLKSNHFHSNRIFKSLATCSLGSAQICAGSSLIFLGLKPLGKAAPRAQPHFCCSLVLPPAPPHGLDAVAGPSLAAAPAAAGEGPVVSAGCGWTSP